MHVIVQYLTIVQVSCKYLFLAAKNRSYLMIMVIIAFHVYVSYMRFGIMMMTHLDSHNRKYNDFIVSNNQSNCHYKVLKAIYHGRL